jgi:Transposase DDE domain
VRSLESYVPAAHPLRPVRDILNEANTKNRASAIDERTTRHPGYAVSQIIRKLIETIFGDGKQHGTLRQLKLRGLERAELVFAMTMTSVNLRRLPKLFAESG